MRKLLGPAMGLAVAAFATPAAAANVNYQYGTGPLTGATYTNFDGSKPGSTTQTTATGITVSFASAPGFVSGSVGGQYAAPIVTGGNGALFGQSDGADTTTYLSTGTGTATFTFANPTNYFGLLWGSVDSYNTLTLNFADGTSFAVNGGFFKNQADIGQSIYANFTASSLITSVVATSTINAFEIDNVATSAVAAVPEAAAWAMMMVGLGVVGGALRRRHSVSTRVSFA